MKNILCLFALVFVATICHVAFSQEDIEENPELAAGYFEGDLVGEDIRNTFRNRSYKWPNNTVYYKINKGFSIDQYKYIIRAMHVIEGVSCIVFREATPDQAYFINITNKKRGCYSSLGYTGTVQELNLEKRQIGDYCFRLGTIIHEFLHALGFVHMQSTYNRDEYVSILKKNIKPDKWYNFEKWSEDQVQDFGIEYDYASIMHYDGKSFSKNGKPTIIAKNRLVAKLWVNEKD